MSSKTLLASLPSSWYFLGFSEEVPPGAVVSRRILDREVVVFRTRSGEIAAVDPYCPHMGAHLGHGGMVEGETLRCPFHAFRFDSQGRCVTTGYGAPPPAKAALRTWPTAERGGFVFVFYDRAGRPPAWQLPPLDLDGWTRPVSYAWDLECHPQDIGENAVDIGHLQIVHGYQPLEVVSPLALDGPFFEVAYRLHRSAGLFFKPGKMTVEVDIHGYGLGYARSDITIPAFGIGFRNDTLVTPSAVGRTTLRVAISLERVTRPGRINPLLWLVPPPLLHRMIARILLFGVIRDVGHDVDILRHRSYVHPPVLARGDGPIVQFRRWAEQFAQPA